jgi:integrase
LKATQLRGRRSGRRLPTPVRVKRLQLCYTHEHRRRALGLRLEEFLRHPRAEPLPGFGRCKVAVCTWQAHARRGLCRPHDVRWREQHRAGLAEAAVELFMDTGRRPAEICHLGWDCLDQDADGKYALVYTDFKANRQGRRLPVADETAEVITG